MAKVLVPIAEGCEELEAVTIIDLLRRAEVEVVTAGLKPGPVKASRGTVLVPDTTLDDVNIDDFDMITLPGGLPGANNLAADARIKQMLQTMAKQQRYVTAICAAPGVLARAGILEGRQATSYPGHLDEFAGPQHIKISKDPVVIDDKVITSRGPGTAMDFALTLIEQLQGPQVRQKVEAGLVRP